MIKKVFLLVLFILVVLPSLVSAYPGSSIGSSYGSSIGSSYGSSLPSSRMEYDSYMNTQKMAYNSYQNDQKIQQMQYDSNMRMQQMNLQQAKVSNDIANSQIKSSMNANLYRQNQIATLSAVRNSQGSFGSGISGSYAPSAPTVPTPDVNKLITQMNEELKLAKSDYNHVSEDLIKIKNRNPLDNFKVSIFGGDPILANGIQQNIANSNNHFSRIYTLNSECNCIDKSGSIIKEADSMRTTLIGISNQAEAEKENKGIIGKIMNTISKSQK